MSSSTVLRADSTEERGEQARLSVFVGAIAIGDLVKSTLGPKGMDKILQSTSGRGSMMITNDGATILKSLQVDNPAAKVLINLSKVQDEEVGDGTTSVCVLAAELLREAERLIEQHKVHPQLIIDGYRMARTAARKALEDSAIVRGTEEELRESLLAIARTTLSSKILGSGGNHSSLEAGTATAMPNNPNAASDREHFAKIAVDAVMRLGGSTNLDRIQVIKKTGGRLRDSYLDKDGFILDQKRAGLSKERTLRNARILLADTPMDTDKVKVFGSRFRVSSPEQLALLERAEKEKMKEKVNLIAGAAGTPNCFINRQLIYDWPQQLLADKGIMTVEHADFDGVDRLALVTGAQIASSFDVDSLKHAVLGKCDLVEEIMLGEDSVVRFSGFSGNGGGACSVVLRGATKQLLDEAERSLHDAFAVLSQTVGEPSIVLGGGASECLMAKAVEDILPGIQGKALLAVEAFARALRQLPTILADNGGWDSGELLAQLRSAHASGNHRMGLDMYAGKIADMRELDVVESLKLKRQVLLSASEAAEMILRVDDIIKAAPRQRRH